MLKKLYVILFITLSFYSGYGQVSCDLPQTALFDTAIPCSQNCVPLSIKIPDIKQTTDYQVISDQYAPYPYQCPSDTELITLYDDDLYSGIVNMPFSFCFYGQNYNKLVIGSNGIVTFDLTNANCDNSYNIPVNTPIPRATGTQCSRAGQYYPRACIMGAFYDIDPSTDSAAPQGRRISYYLTGTAPYRKMVIVYYHVPIYGSSCNALQTPRELADQEIVLYESTGVIDVHIGNKPLCIGSTSQGRAILGIQNWDRTQAVAASGKNCTQWTAFNETYRFIPSGVGASLFKNVALYQGNTLIDTGTTVSNGEGQLVASFANSVCFNTDTAVYRVIATYASCSDPNAEIPYETKVVVRHNTTLSVTAGFVAATCALGGMGIVTLTDPIGPQYEYSIDNGITYQPSPVFTVPGGTYSVIARNTLAGCIGATILTIPIIETIRFTTSTANATCYGAPNGQVLILTQAGAAPFQFSSDGGVTYQGSNLMLLPAGVHTIRVKDNNNCTRDTTITVNQPDSISIALPLVNDAFCSGNPDGQIIVSATGGTPVYKYSLNGTAYQNSDTLFANVGNYTIYVKDNNGCVYSKSGITVALNDTMRLQPLPDTSVCVGSSLTIAPNTNATAFSWSPNIFISNTTSARPVISPQDTITYYLQAKLGTLCSRTDTFNVDVLKRPIPDAGPDTIICFGTQAYFHATAIRGNKYRWTPAANLNSTTRPNPIATGFMPITYVVEVTDPYGCGFKEYDTLRLTVRPKVRAFAGQDTTATLGTPVQLSGCCMDIYQWTPSSVFVNDTARNPVGNFPAGTTQVVMLTTTPEGCEGRDTVLVKGYQGPTYYVPSAFSPGNQDGLNDRFLPIPVGITETYYFNVFNRFGQMVFSTKTFMQGWDGRWKGELQANGAYVWMVRGKGIDGKIVEKKGTVILIR